MSPSRRMERDSDQERRPPGDDDAPAVAEEARARPQERSQRTGVVAFLREVRAELRRVAWPSRRELLSYSLVVLVVVTLLTLYVFGLDQAFGQLVFLIFGG